MNFRPIITVLAAASIIAACKKNDNPTNVAPQKPTVTQTQLTGSATTSAAVTSRNWKVTKVTVQGLDATHTFFKSCELDNIYTLRSDFTLKMDEGATKCNDNDAQTQDGTWGLNSDNTFFYVKTRTDSIGGSVTASSANSITIGHTANGVTGNITFDAQ